MDNMQKIKENADKLWLFVFSIMSGILNYVFQIIISRELSVADFGEFNAINSFVVNALNIYMPLCVIGCRVTAENHGKIDINRKIHYQLMIIMSIISVTILLGAPIAFSIYKGNRSTYSIFIICLLLIVTAYFNYAFYVIQGMQLFFWYGLGSLLLVALKTILSVIFVSHGYGIDGVVISMILGYMVLLVLGIVIIRKRYEKGNERANSFLSIRYLLNLYSITFISQIFFSLYVNNGEVLIMKLFYDEKEIGLYSSASILGKASVYLYTILATIILPNIAEIKDDYSKIKKKYRQMAGLCTGISLIYAIFFVFLGHFVIQFLFGGEYESAKKYIWSLALLVLPLNINLVTYNFLLALNKLTEFTISMILLMIMTVAIIVNIHPSINIVVVIWAVAMSINALVGWGVIKKLWMKDEMNV